MARRSIVAGAVCGLLFVGSVRCFAGSKKSSQDAEALLARARELSDLKAKGSPPFDLDASFTLYNLAGDHTQGVYRLMWASPTEWRDEVLLPGHSTVAVEHAGESWHTSVLPYTPYLIFQLRQALTFPSRLQVPPKEKLTKVKEGKIDGVTAECVGYRYSHPRARVETFCFDHASGYLLSDVSREWYTTLELSDYKTVGSKSFPQTLRVLQNGQLIVEVKVLNVTPNFVVTPALFAPPPGIHPSPSNHCTGTSIVPAQALVQPEPRYPDYAKEHRIMGTVVMYGDIGKDGVPRGLDVLHSPAQVLTDASLAAVRQWRYAPARCGSAPMDVTTSIGVNFTLSE